MSTNRRKVCPACGIKNYWFEQDTICCACRRDIDYGKSRKEADEKAAIAREQNGAVTWYTYPHLPAFYGIINLSSEENSRFRSIFKDLEARLTIQEPGVHNAPYDWEHLLYGSRSDWDRASQVELIKGDGELIRKIYEAWLEFGRMCYAQGKKDGSDLLINLAAGQISFEELNKRSIG